MSAGRENESPTYLEQTMPFLRRHIGPRTLAAEQQAYAR